MVRKGNLAHVFYCFLGGNHDDSTFFYFAFVGITLIGIAPERKRQCTLWRNGTQSIYAHFHPTRLLGFDVSTGLAISGI
jgi:hypothetical protein